MSSFPEFVFVTCQIGAEPALKSELARNHPGLKFAYSRPGFLTFKITDPPESPDHFELRSVFVRAWAFSLGKVTGETLEERVRSILEIAGARPVVCWHVWPRDRHPPGYRDYEPGITPEADAVGLALAGATGLPTNPSTTVFISGGELAGDVVLVGENEWWVGFHRISSIESSWPGGLLQQKLPAGTVSRVYLKMREGLAWSGFRMQPGQVCIEIGCAPGGASQALLDLGQKVIGIDPAEMHPDVLARPGFRHIRRRSKEVRRRDFLGCDWLTCDINLPPNYTLDTVEAIVAYPDVRFRGMLVTLKLIEWSLAENIPEYLERIRSWGFSTVRARQLQHNRQEICVACS